MTLAETAPAFTTFVQAMVASQDTRPFYLVLRQAQRAMSREQALWCSFLFLAFDHLGSAWEAFQAKPLPGPLQERFHRLPIYLDRRGLRGGRIAQHIQSYLGAIQATAGKQYPWLTHGWTANPIQNYERFWQRGHTIWGNGRWAVFKWAEILQKIHGFCIAAPDMRAHGASGPRAGLGLLAGVPPSQISDATYDALGILLMERLQRDGVYVDWEILEKLLCNWHSLLHGRYYVGYDIDAMQEEILTIPDPQAQARLFTARAAVLPREYLGEARGWHGVQKHRLGRYKTLGVLDG